MYETYKKELKFNSIVDQHAYLAIKQNVHQQLPLPGLSLFFGTVNRMFWLRAFS